MMSTLLKFMYNYSAELLNNEDSSFCCRDGKIAVEPLPPLSPGWTEMFMETNFRYNSYCIIMSILFYMIFIFRKASRKYNSFTTIGVSGPEGFAPMAVPSCVKISQTTSHMVNFQVKKLLYI